MSETPRVDAFARLPENADSGMFNPFRELAESLEIELITCQELLSEKHIEINKQTRNQQI